MIAVLRQLEGLVDVERHQGDAVLYLGFLTRPTSTPASFTASSGHDAGRVHRTRLELVGVGEEPRVRQLHDRAATVKMAITEKTSTLTSWPSKSSSAASHPHERRSLRYRPGKASQIWLTLPHLVVAADEGCEAGARAAILHLEERGDRAAELVDVAVEAVNEVLEACRAVPRSFQGPCLRCRSCDPSRPG